MILAIDPGPRESAFVLYDHERPVRTGKAPNAFLLADLLQSKQCAGPFSRADDLAIEMIASYGMPVGAEVFETCVWIGRFIQAWDAPHRLVYRKDVKLHLCGSVRAKDGNVRQALIDKYGGKEKAIGKKVTPGPLYGVTADVWSALAVAITHSERTRG